MLMCRTSVVWFSFNTDWKRHIRGFSSYDILLHTVIGFTWTLQTHVCNFAICFLSYKIKVGRCTSGCDTSVSVFTSHIFDHPLLQIVFISCLWIGSNIHVMHFLSLSPKPLCDNLSKICDINNRLFISAHPFSLIFVSHASRSFNF